MLEKQSLALTVRQPNNASLQLSEPSSVYRTAALLCKALGYAQLRANGEGFGSEDAGCADLTWGLGDDACCERSDEHTFAFVGR